MHERARPLRERVLCRLRRRQRLSLRTASHTATQPQQRHHSARLLRAQEGLAIWNYCRASFYFEALVCSAHRGIRSAHIPRTSKDSSMPRRLLRPFPLRNATLAVSLVATILTVPIVAAT